MVMEAPATLYFEVNDLLVVAAKGIKKHGALYSSIVLGVINHYFYDILFRDEVHPFRLPAEDYLHCNLIPVVRVVYYANTIAVLKIAHQDFTKTFYNSNSDSENASQVTNSEHNDKIALYGNT